MPRISLDDFNSAVDSRFEDVEFDVAGDKVSKFVQPLRLTDGKRDELGEKFGRFQANDFESEEDMRGHILSIFELCAKTKADYTAFKKHLGADTAKHIVAAELLLTAFGGLMGVGEA